MASSNEEMILKLKIESEAANAALRKTEVEIKKTIQSFRKLKKGSLDYQAAQAKLASLQAKQSKQSIIVNKKAKQSLDNLNKGLDGTSEKTGAATASAMELSRVISDAPYGIRGMANNITQLVSQLGYQAASTNTATGATLGYVGALKAMWSALMGPLGIVLL
jgi:VIT1/CCC1 family predicted Fe2+/Mn2+ transporter